MTADRPAIGNVCHLGAWVSGNDGGDGGRGEWSARRSAAATGEPGTTAPPGTL